MARKRHSTEEIVNKLCEAEVLIANRTTVAQVCKHIGVTDQTYYKWRREFGTADTKPGCEADFIGMVNFSDLFSALGVYGVCP